MSTIFSRIIKGEIPCHKVYEDAHVLAFLDIGPLSSGHTLVIPKEEKAHLHELTDEAGAAIGRALPRICRAVLKATGATSYNVLQNNGSLAHQAVFHVHFHIIPRFEGSGSGVGPNGRGLDFAWPAGKLDHAAGAELVRKIAAAMG